jgi:catechol 2,3-dioxygenase-like lactoylglutathione lyase family enzyme
MNAEHIGLYAKDPTGLCRWYVEKLGFSVIRTLEKEGRPPIYFVRGDAGMVIEILPTTSPRNPRGLADPGFSHVGLVVPHFDEAVAALQSASVSVHDIRKTSNGWTIGYLEDPEGNQLELVYRPPD